MIARVMLFTLGLFIILVSLWGTPYLIIQLDVAEWMIIPTLVTGLAVWIFGVCISSYAVFELK